MSEDFFDDLPQDFLDELDTPVPYFGNEAEAVKEVECFNCLGEASLEGVNLHPQGFINNFKLNPSDHSKDGLGKREQIVLFDRKWDRGSIFHTRFESLSRLFSQSFMLIDSAAKVNVSFLGAGPVWLNKQQCDYKTLRKNCVQFLSALWEYVACLTNTLEHSWVSQELRPKVLKFLLSTRLVIGKITDLPDYVYLHCANSSGNKCSKPSYNLLHLHLDTRWFHLIISNLLSKTQVPHENDESLPFIHTAHTCGPDDIKEIIKFLISDLLLLAIARFEKITFSELPRKSAFSCTCVQELWILIQTFTDQECEDGEQEGSTFLLYLSEQLSTILSKNSETPVSQESQEDTFEEDCLNFSPPKQYNCSNPPLFCLWFLSSFSNTFRYKNRVVPSCYPLLESAIKTIVGSEIKESEMRICLEFIEKLCIDLWEPKTEPLLLFWDYYLKRINNPFYVRGATPDTMAIMSKSSYGLISQIKAYLNDRNCVHDSFQHFLRVLGLHLKKGQDNPRHWNLVKGRVYSKFTPAKIVSLTKVGELHFSSLFLMLALTGDHNQVVKRMTDLVEASQAHKGTLSLDLIKGQLALVMLLIEKKEEICIAIQPVANYMNGISVTQKKEPFQIYIETLRDILDVHGPLQFGQHYFIDYWIAHFLSYATESESAKLLDILVTIIQKLKPTIQFSSPDQGSILVVEHLWDQLKMFLSHAFNQASTFYQVADLGADLATISLQMNNLERFKEICQVFTACETTEIRLLRRFLCHLLNHEDVKHCLPGCDKIVIKVWLRCCFVCTDIHHGEMKTLLKHISQLDDVKDICMLLGNDIVDAEDPVLEFFSALNKKYSHTQDIFAKQALREKVGLYLEGIDKWLKPLVSPPKDAELVKRLFFIVGSMVKLVAPLLYTKSKSNTTLQLLLDTLLIPVSVRNPEAKLNTHLGVAISKTIHLFIEGLLQLDPVNDPYISRSTKEIFQVYVPKCVTSFGGNNVYCYQTFSLSSQFYAFPKNLKKFILNCLCQTFLKKKAKVPHPQAACALKFIKYLINTHHMWPEVMSVVIGSCLDRLCDVCMHCENRSTVCTIAKDVLKSLLNSHSIRSATNMEIVQTAFKKLCAEHLAWSSNQMIELFVFMSSQAPDLVLRFIPHLTKSIKEVEEKRGLTYDRTLRLGLDKIHKCLNSIKDESRSVNTL